ncbi:GNAT family N-acetyltransferase [Verrucomicrobiota bacterium]
MDIQERANRLPIINTAHLVLRDIEVADISEAYVAWLNDPVTTRFLEVRFAPQTPDTVREYVEAKLSDTHNTKHFGIYDQDGERLVGTVTLPVISWKHIYSDVSFVIGHPGAQGKGYATEAVNAVSYYAFRRCGLAKLWGGYYGGHVASARVFEKNGFRVEGQLRKKFVNADGERVDHVLVGLLAEDYVPNEALLGPLPAEAE